MRVRIIIDNRLELLARRSASLVRRSEAAIPRLRGHSRRTYRRIKRSHRCRKLGASLFILLVDVVPPAKRNRGDDHNRNDRGNEFRLVLDAPVSGAPRSLECDFAEAVFFQLSPGFCAHGFPSLINGGMTNN